MEVGTILSLALPAILSFLASWYVYIPVLHLAQLKHFRDNPDARKLQKTPIPVMGGVAVYFGFICGVLLTACFSHLGSHVLLVIAAMTILLIVGVVDDMLDVSPLKRLLAEAASILGLIYGSSMCIDSFHGLWGVQSFSWDLAVPLTVFGCVGIINAINMIDGVNGLSSGLCIICCVLFSILFIQGQDYVNTGLNLMMAASLVPFWIHNVMGKKSRMFIGDAGTMVMGALMSWNVIQILSTQTSTEWMAHTNQGIGHVAVVLSILAVPVFDTIRVIIMRIIHHRSPFSADKTHLHHIIYDYSHSHSITSLGEILMTLLIFLAGTIAFFCGLSVTGQFYVIFLIALLFVWGTYFLLSYNIRLNTGFAYKTRKVLLAMRQGETNWWHKVQTWVDRGA